MYGANIFVFVLIETKNLFEQYKKMVDKNRVC